MDHCGNPGDHLYSGFLCPHPSLSFNQLLRHDIIFYYFLFPYPFLLFHNRLVSLKRFPLLTCIAHSFVAIWRNSLSLELFKEESSSIKMALTLSQYVMLIHISNNWIICHNFYYLTQNKSQIYRLVISWSYFYSSATIFHSPLLLGHFSETLQTAVRFRNLTSRKNLIFETVSFQLLQDLSR